ncbi:MAG: DMT family transporter [Chloroflexota bacterium]
MLRRGSQLQAVVQALFVVFLWATSWVFIKVGLEEMPALTFAGLRYTLAFICLLPLVFFSRQLAALRSVSRRTWGRLLILGVLLYAVTQGAVFVALALLPAVTVNLLWSFSSAAVALMGLVWLAERPTWFQWLGVGLTILGAVFYFYPVALPASQLWGVLVAGCGILANAGASILGRDVNRRGDIPPLVVTVISMGIGSMALLATGIAVQGFPNIGLRSWAIVAWLAIVNTAYAFTLWNQTLRTLSATESSIINGTMLIWIPVLAVVFLNERVTVKEVFGLAVVGVGTLMVQLRQPWSMTRLLKSCLKIGILR